MPRDVGGGGIWPGRATKGSTAPGQKLVTIIGIAHQLLSRCAPGSPMKTYKAENKDGRLRNGPIISAE